MSETKGAAMSETAVERRLRDEREEGCTCHRCESLDAGREAIRILADWENDETPQDGPSRKWKARVAALLARCEGE